MSSCNGIFCKRRFGALHWSWELLVINCSVVEKDPEATARICVKLAAECTNIMGHRLYETILFGGTESHI